MSNLDLICQHLGAVKGDKEHAWLHRETLDEICFMVIEDISRYNVRLFMSDKLRDYAKEGRYYLTEFNTIKTGDAFIRLVERKLAEVKPIVEAAKVKYLAYQERQRLQAASMARIAVVMQADERFSHDKLLTKEHVSVRPNAGGNLTYELKIDYLTEDDVIKVLQALQPQN